MFEKVAGFPGEIKHEADDSRNMNTATSLIDFTEK